MRPIGALIYFNQVLHCKLKRKSPRKACSMSKEPSGPHYYGG